MDIKNFTCLGSGSGVTLSLCHSVSVTLWIINSLITPYMLPFISLGRNFFLHPFGQKTMSQKKLSRAKKTVICQAISAILQDIGLKIETTA